MKRSVAVLLAAAAGATVSMPHASAFQGTLTSLRVPIGNFGKLQQKSEGWISRIPSLPIRPAHRLRLKGGLSSLSAMTTTSTKEIAAPVEKFRKDYKAPDYLIANVELTFKIFKGHTQVQATSKAANHHSSHQESAVTVVVQQWNTLKTLHIAGSFIPQGYKKGRRGSHQPAPTGRRKPRTQQNSRRRKPTP